jgi:UDP-N-acetylmuramate--alanine ligase
MILDRMKKKSGRVLTREELLNWIKNDYRKKIDREFGAMLITAGAGDIDMLVEPIKKYLEDPGA